MQAVCISNRPEVFTETLAYWDSLALWIDTVIVVCPAALCADVRAQGRIRVEATAEEAILGSLASRFASARDHQYRNLLLRRAIADCAEVNDEFLMFDDDHRPLFPIAQEFFVDQGRHHAYTFYNLDHWRATASDFDRGQHNTATTLRERGLPAMSYASHMPQIINRALLQSAFKSFSPEIDDGLPLDEWSLYFNHALAHHPEQFHEPRPFVTLCWPALPTDWVYDIIPTDFAFENFSDRLYEPGRLFGDLPTAFDADRNADLTATKIRRRTRIQRAFESPSAQVQRKLCWMLYRLLQRIDRGTARHSRIRNALRTMTPKATRSKARDILTHGADPAFWKSYG